MRMTCPGADLTKLNPALQLSMCTVTHVRAGINMIGALVACSLIGSFCQNTVSAQEVLDDGEVGGDDKIVFPGGEEIDAINEIIEDLVKSEEFKSSNSSTNDADSSIVRTTTGLKYIITNVPTSA